MSKTKIYTIGVGLIALGGLIHTGLYAALFILGAGAVLFVLVDCED